jgi:hypothetical protein
MTGHSMKKLVIYMSLCLFWTATASAQPLATRQSRFIPGSSPSRLTEGKRGCTQCSPPQDQQRAQELFLKARSLLQEEQYGEAAALYEQALGHWDNPLIRYALARALSLQHRLVEARAHVDEVLAYGSECFDPRMWEHVQKLAGFLQKRLADMGKLEIVCREPGAQVALDGLAGFTCNELRDRAQATCPNPESRIQIRDGWTITDRGEASRLVSPGTHRITASKPGHDTVSRAVVVSAGDKSRFVVDRSRAAREHGQTGKLVAGWLMFGTGAIAVGAGAALHAGKGEAIPGTRASYVFGGITGAAGLALLLHYSYEVRRERRNRNDMLVAPMISDQVVGASLGFEF